jgi:hypothetical protein
VDRVRLLEWLAPLIFLCLLASEAYGFRTAPLFAQRIWDPEGLERLGRYGGWFLALSAPVLLMVPWAFPAVLAGLVLLLTAMSTGPLPLLAVAYFLISACALGSLLLDGDGPSELATVLGMGVYIFLMTLTARLPVHYSWSWGILLAIPIAADWRGVRRRLVEWKSALFSVRLNSWAERAAFGVLMFVLGMHWLLVLKPEKSADGLAMHLAIPAGIASHHFLPFEPNLYMWSVMPMGGDFCYSIVYLFGGEFAARLLTFSALLLVLAMLNAAIREMVPASVRYLVLLLFAATPLVQLVTGSLFVENLWAAVILAAITAVWQFAEKRRSRFLFAAAALAGTAMASKFGSLSFVVMLLPLACAEAWRQGPKARRLIPAALLLFLLVALPAYVIAWRKTGNPIYPFLNEKLHSPLVDPTVGFGDYEFTMPVTWRTLYQLTFETHRFYEAQDGAFGFHYLLLLPLCAAGLLVLRRKPAAAFAVGTGAALLTFRSDANARYLYPALPLLLIASVGLLAWLREHSRWMYRTLLFCLALSAIVNIYFLPASGWYHKDFYMKSTFRRDASDRYIRDVVPLRYIVREFNRRHPGEAVFFTEEPDVPDASGPVYENHWHQFPLVSRLRRADRVEAVADLAGQLGVRYFISRKPSSREHLEPFILAKFLDQCTITEFEWSIFRLSRVEQCVPTL